MQIVAKPIEELVLKWAAYDDFDPSISRACFLVRILRLPHLRGYYTWLDARLRIAKVNHMRQKKEVCVYRGKLTTDYVRESIINEAESPIREHWALTDSGLSYTRLTKFEVADKRSVTARYAIAIIYNTQYTLLNVRHGPCLVNINEFFHFNLSMVRPYWSRISYSFRNDDLLAKSNERMSLAKREIPVQGCSMARGAKLTK